MIHFSLFPLGFFPLPYKREHVFFYVEDPRRRVSSFLCFLDAFLSSFWPCSVLLPWSNFSSLSSGATGLHCAPHRELLKVLNNLLQSSKSTSDFYLLADVTPASRRWDSHASSTPLPWPELPPTFMGATFLLPPLTSLMHMDRVPPQAVWLCSPPNPKSMKWLSLCGSGHGPTFMKHQLHMFTIQSAISSHLPDLKMNLSPFWGLPEQPWSVASMVGMPRNKMGAHSNAVLSLAPLRLLLGVGDRSLWVALKYDFSWSPTFYPFSYHH